MCKRHRDPDKVKATKLIKNGHQRVIKNIYWHSLLGFLRLHVGLSQRVGLEVLAARFHQDLSPLVTESNAILMGRLEKNISHRRLARRMSEISHSRSAAVHRGLRAKLWEARILEPGELVININKWWGKKEKVLWRPLQVMTTEVSFLFWGRFLCLLSACGKRHTVSLAKLSIWPDAAGPDDNIVWSTVSLELVQKATYKTPIWAAGLRLLYSQFSAKY